MCVVTRVVSSGLNPRPKLIELLDGTFVVQVIVAPVDGSELLAPLESDPRMARHHRLAAVRAHLLEMLGDEPGALESYRAAARRTTSLPEKRYLEERAARLSS